MKYSFILLILYFLLACDASENKNRKIDGPINTEIGARIKLLNTNGVQADSIKINPNEVDSVVNSLILLSKDIENISASIGKSNRYFDTLAIKFKLNSYSFIPVKNGMHVDDIATTLKQNELSFLNMILLKNNKSDLLLHTAQ